MIYATVILSVEEHISTYDKKVVLYRGDKNVEIRFVIKDNRFTILDDTYAQMIIRRPTSASIFSEPAAIQNDTVILTITEDMIDELEEVGEYSFQIRLYDSNMTARATLPPCEGCLLVKHPIAVENEALINQSLVNYSTLLTGDESEEVFDDDGNYNMTKWLDGDVITDTRLNKTEEAIWHNTKSILQLEEDVETIPKKTSELTNDTDFTTKTYVDNAIDNIDVTEELNKLEQIKTSDTEPTDDNVSLWINISEDAPVNIIPEIDDNIMTPNSTWSSEKIYNELLDVIVGSSVDLSGYAKKTELHSHDNKTVIDGITSNMITSWNNKLSSIPSEYITETILNSKGYLTETALNDKGYITEINGTLSHFLPKANFTVTTGSSTSGSYLSTKWSVPSADGISIPYDGMMVTIRVPSAGLSSAGVILSIDNGVSYHPVVRNKNTVMSTYYSADSTITVVYNATQTATAYLESGKSTTLTGVWQIADYDADTKTSSSNNENKKMFIIGATTQSTSGQTTYSNSKCYIGSDNCLYSNGEVVLTDIPTHTHNYLTSSDMTTRDRLHVSLIPTGTSIPSNADLNTIDYIKVGSYFCPSNAIGKTLVNSPIPVAFMMEVSSTLSPSYDNETTGTWVYRLRKITHYSSGEQYIQQVYSGGTAGAFTYGAWNKVAFSSEIPTVPTKVSQLTNDSGYLTEHIDISGKVDKVDGKGLSTNDYTAAEKTKLAGIETGATKTKVWLAKECTTFTSDDTSSTCTPAAVKKAVGMFDPKSHTHSEYATKEDINNLLDKINQIATHLGITLD